MSTPVQFSRVVLIGCSLSAATVFSPNLPAVAAPKESGDRKQAASAAHEFSYHVVTTRRKPVAGATVRPWSLACDSGSFLLPEELFPSATTDANGNVRIIFPKEGNGPEIHKIREAEKQGISAIALRVDHPDHPVWSGYLGVDGDHRIMLSDSTTIEVRAHREKSSALLRRLFPSLPGPLFEGRDWSEQDGLLTIRRVDATGDHACRWLRIVQIPEKGPPLFSDLIDMKLRLENPMRLEVAMKPGVRVTGRLAEEVPRPVRDGRVVAQIVHGPAGSNVWKWYATAKIDADGCFVLESLPPDENLQVIALCDGWVSRAPTVEEAKAYAAEHDFLDLEYRGPASIFVYPRLYRLKGPLIQRVVPMRQTATCEVTVVDELGQPIRGASVEFWPNQAFFNSGAQIVGTGFDSLKVIQSIPPGKRATVPDLTSFWARYSATTKPDGVAIVRNLPLGETAQAGEPREVSFDASCTGYISEPGVLNPATGRISLLPGRTGRVTVQLKRK
jgi:hypothetical protein